MKNHRDQRKLDDACRVVNAKRKPVSKQGRISMKSAVLAVRKFLAKNAAH